MNGLSQRWRRGSALGYVVLAMVAVTGVISLAVDYGRVQIVKSELQSATDGAARAAVAALPQGVAKARQRAASVALANSADGRALVLDPQNNVEFGNWNSSTQQFTPASGAAQQAAATAVRVTARLDASLHFASLFGRSSVGVEVSAIATSKPTGYGVVGLDYIKMSGNASNSYYSTGSSSFGDRGSIASNGQIVLSGNTSVHGDAHPGVGKSVTGDSRVSGLTTPLAQPLVYPPGDASAYYNDNNNAVIPSWAMSANSFDPPNNRSLTLPGGHYVFNNFTLTAKNSLTFTGPATIYCYGNFSLSGSAQTSADLPKNLRIVMVKNPYTNALPGSVTIGSGTAIYADIYAPQSPVLLSGNGDIYGSVLGKSVDMTGSSAIHYDLALPGAQGNVQLVQ